MGPSQCMPDGIKTPMAQVAALAQSKGLVSTDRDLPMLKAAEIPFPKDIPPVQSVNPTSTARCLGQSTGK